MLLLEQLLIVTKKHVASSMKVFVSAHQILIGTVVLFLVASPPLCSGGEDVLRLLVWGGYAPKEFVAQFEKSIQEKYDRKVKLEVSFVEKSDDFYDPVREKGVDLITISHNLFKDERFNFLSKNLLLPLDVVNIPNSSSLTTFLASADYHSYNGGIYGMPVGQGSYGLACNLKKVLSLPDTLQILWEAKYVNHYVIGAHEYLYNANITALALGYNPDNVSSYDILNNPEFKDKLSRLARGAQAFYGGTDSVKVINDASLALIWGDSLKPLIDSGENWKMVETKEGVPWWIDDYAITWALKDKPFLKKVAEEWINVVLSSQFQVKNNVRRLRIYPVVTNINDKLTAEEKQRVQFDGNGVLKEKRILQATVSQRDRNGIKLLWDEAMKNASSESSL